MGEIYKMKLPTIEEKVERNEDDPTEQVYCRYKKTSESQLLFTIYEYK